MAPVRRFKAAVIGQSISVFVQVRNLQSLQAPTNLVSPNTVLKVKNSKTTGLPIFIKGQIKNLPEGELEAQSFAFLKEVETALKIENTDSEFTIKSIKKDALGESHIRNRTSL